MMYLYGIGRSKMKKHNRGFTFIELVLSLAVLGVVGAMTVPQYVDAAQQALDDAKWEKSVAVKDKFVEVASTRNKIPTVAVLAAYLPGETAKALPEGIRLMVDGKAYTVPTYSNSTCTILTKNVEEKVLCVGSIS